MSEKLTKLAVGMLVRATTPIWRRDGRYSLRKGDTATVVSAQDAPHEGVQIVHVKLNDGGDMIDIVVANGIPLEPVKE